jgi:hypothetical protein
MNRPEDVEIGAITSPVVGVLGATSYVFDTVAMGEVVVVEDRLFENLNTE